jgi:hypothetical protein
LPPALTQYTSEGIVFRQLVFQDGPRRITYELPSQWNYRSTEDSVKLVPPGNSNADIAIQTRPLPAPRPLDDKGVAAAREHFLQSLPPAIQALEVLGEELNTVPLRAGANFEMTASYQLLGQTFTRRALYVHLPETQLIFRLAARKNEFESLWRTFRTSILSWQWVEASPTTVAKNAAMQTAAVPRQ